VRQEKAMKQDNVTIKKLTIRILSVMVFSLFAIACNADSEQATKESTTNYTSGKEYTQIGNPIPTSTDGNVEVTELFWFGCAHCFSLEPYIKKWLKNKPAKTEFKKVPAIFSERWEFHAKAFYAMQLLNVIEQTEMPFFNAIHINKTPMYSVDHLILFLADYGITKEQVIDAFDSFAVDSNVRSAKALSMRSGARGVPAFIVGGKYLTSLPQAGSQEQLFEVVNFLINKIQQEG